MLMPNTQAQAVLSSPPTCFGIRKHIKKYRVWENTDFSCDLAGMRDLKSDFGVAQASFKTSGGEDVDARPLRGRSYSIQLIIVPASVERCPCSVCGIWVCTWTRWDLSEPPTLINSARWYSVILQLEWNVEEGANCRPRLI